MKIISDIKDKNVIVSPLDWGLGHSSRIIPVIRELKKNSNRVTIVCGKGSFCFLKTELPDFEIIALTEKRIKYPSTKINFFTVINWVFTMTFNTINEHKKIKKIIKEKNTQIIISDNRYGLYFKNLDCYIVTHQIAPKVPHGIRFLQKISDYIFKKVLKKFKQVLIPDFEDGFSLTGSLAGDLKGENYAKIGILSRFSGLISAEKSIKKYDFLVLISGQEMQRTVFENILIEHAKKTDKKILFVRGVFSKEKLEDFNNVIFYNSLTGSSLEEAFLKSEIVICRAGYSTLCDLCALQKKAVIIPTPGQSEQEFLAERLNGKFGFKTVKQTDLEKLKNVFTFAELNC